jgi:hypothetical protein
MADPIEPPKPATTVRVRALARGFYGCLREIGDVFDIAADADLGGWMDPIEKRDRERNAVKLAAYAKNRTKPPDPKTKATPAIRLR